MTTDIERQFFDTFGIEPDEEKYCYWECKKPELENVACNNTECEHYRHKIYYPQITDSILLELILIYSQISNLPICYDTVESFKEGVLECFIEDSEDFKHQVRTLFKDG